MDEIVMGWVGLFLIAVLVLVGLFTTKRLKEIEHKKQEDVRTEAQREWQAMEDEWEAISIAHGVKLDMERVSEFTKRFEEKQKKLRLEEVKLAQRRRMRMRRAKTLYRQPRNF